MNSFINYRFAFFITKLLCIFLGMQLSAQNALLFTDSLVNEYTKSTSDSAFYMIGLELMETNNALSIKDAKYLFQEYQGSEHQLKRILGYSILADVFFYKDMLDSSMYYYMNQAFLAEELHMAEHATSGYGNAAYVLSDLGYKQSAIDMLKEKMPLARSTGDSRDVADYYYNLSTNYIDLNQLDSAVHYMKACLDIDLQNNNVQGVIANLRRIVDINMLAQNYERAKSYCFDCIEKAKKHNDLRSLGSCQYLMSKIFDAQKQHEKSKSYIKKALQLTQDRRDLNKIPIYKSALGNVEFKLGNVEIANTLYQEAMEASKRSKKSAQLANISLDFAEILLVQDKLSEAEEILLDTEESVNKFGWKKIVRQLYQLQIELGKKKKDKEKVIYYQDKLIQIQKDNENISLNTSINEPNVLFQLFRTRQEQTELIAEQKELKRISDTRFRLLVVSSIVILLLSLLMWSLWMYFRQKRLLTEQKNKQNLAELKSDMYRKELIALRAQMNPHFLFNSLTSINNYIMHEEPRMASKYLTKFSHLMRKVLNNSEKNLIVLDEELRTLSLYCEMENIRFDNRFDIQLNVDPSIHTTKTYLPTMILQPFIENAIHHGLNHKQGSGSLDVFIQKISDTKIKVTIADDGVGREKAQEIKDKKVVKNKSLGMKLTKDRITLIKELYKINTEVNVRDLMDAHGAVAGTEIELILPFINDENVNVYENQ